MNQPITNDVSRLILDDGTAFTNVTIVYTPSDSDMNQPRFDQHSQFLTVEVDGIEAYEYNADLINNHLDNFRKMAGAHKPHELSESAEQELQDKYSTTDPSDKQLLHEHEPKIQLTFPIHKIETIAW